MRTIRYRIIVFLRKQQIYELVKLKQKACIKWWNWLIVYVLFLLPLKRKCHGKSLLWWWSCSLSLFIFIFFENLHYYNIVVNLGGYNFRGLGGSQAWERDHEENLRETYFSIDDFLTFFWWLDLNLWSYTIKKNIYH